VVELKQGQELGEGGGVQLAHHEAAVAELIAAGVLAAASETRLLCGAPEEVLALLGVRRP